MNPDKRLKIINIITVLLIVALSPLIAVSEDNSKTPINITSDSMEAEIKKDRVTFIGNVVARQKDMTINSDVLVASYADGGKELKEVLATGNVRITQQDKIATAEKAVFLNVERKIVLTGSPRVWQGKDIVAGDRIIYFVDEDRTIVEGGQDRVRARIHPKKEETFANSTGKGVE